MITRSFEEELLSSGRLVCPNWGTSMLPLIRQGKDLMVIIPRPNRRLRKYEAVFFRRGESYLLHRILKVNDGEYLIGADNRTNTEIVKDDQIIGVLYSVLRDGSREVKAKGLACRGYVFFWYILRPKLRKVKQVIKKMLGR